jgi:hypothetical protein
MHRYIEKLHVIRVDSQDNNSKVLFVLDLLKDDFQNQLLFISAQDSSVINTSLQFAKEKIKNLDKNLRNIEFFFLQKSWSDLFQEYGASIFKSEFKSLISDSQVEIIYFHDIHNFFIGMSKEELQLLIKEIIEIVEHYNKKIIFSYSSSTHSGQEMDFILNSLVEITFYISKCLNSTKHFKMHVHKVLDQKKTRKLVLISDDDEIKSLHTYLFDNHKYFKLELFSSQLATNTLETIFDDTDMIIFNAKDNQLRENILKLKSNSNSKIKFIEINQNSSLRNQDKINAHKYGVDFLFSKDFDISLYMYRLENLFDYKFYIFKRETISTLAADENTIITDAQQFETTLNHMINERIYFIIMKFELSDEDNLDMTLVKNLVRDKNNIFFDKTEKCIIFIMLDVLPSKAYILLDKRIKEHNLSLIYKETLCANKLQSEDIKTLLFHKQEHKVSNG